MSPPTATTTTTTTTHPKPGIHSHREIVSPPNPHTMVRRGTKNDGPVVEVMGSTTETSKPMRPETRIALDYVKRFNDEPITTIPVFKVRSSLYKSLTAY